MATPLSLSLLLEFQAEIAKIVIVAFRGKINEFYFNDGAPSVPSFYQNTPGLFYVVQVRASH
jgi:hypothetical protein